MRPLAALPRRRRLAGESPSRDPYPAFRVDPALTVPPPTGVTGPCGTPPSSPGGRHGGCSPPIPRRRPSRRSPPGHEPRGSEPVTTRTTRTTRTDDSDSGAQSSPRVSDSDSDAYCWATSRWAVTVGRSRHGGPACDDFPVTTRTTRTARTLGTHPVDLVGLRSRPAPPPRAAVLAVWCRSTAGPPPQAGRPAGSIEPSPPSPPGPSRGGKPRLLRPSSRPRLLWVAPARPLQAGPLINRPG